MPGLAHRLTPTLRPLLRLYGWWLGLDLGSRGRMALLPDTLAILYAASAVGFLAPFLCAVHPAACALAVLASPCALLLAVWVSPRRILCVRLLGPLPYWVHAVPADARLELDQAWEDPAPTGIAFETRPPRDALRLGTGRSAQALFDFTAAALEAFGWSGVAPARARPGPTETPR